MVTSGCHTRDVAEQSGNGGDTSLQNGEILHLGNCLEVLHMCTISRSNVKIAILKQATPAKIWWHWLSVNCQVKSMLLISLTWNATWVIAWKLPLKNISQEPIYWLAAWSAFEIKYGMQNVCTPSWCPILMQSHLDHAFFPVQQPCSILPWHLGSLCLLSFTSLHPFQVSSWSKNPTACALSWEY